MSVDVSICIPAHNPPPPFLEAAIRSALDQEEVGLRLEVVVSDDASQEDYGDSVPALGDPRVRLFENECNLGMVGNWNTAVRRSRGRFVVLLGQDDLLRPGMVAAYLSTVRDDRHVSLWSCGREFIDASGELLPPPQTHHDRSKIFSSAGWYVLPQCEAVRLCLRNGNPIGEPSAVLFTRHVFDEIGGYDPAFGHAADVDFNLRAARLGSILYTTTPYLLRRLHRDALTGVNFESGKITADRERLFRRHVGSCPFSRREIAAFHAYLVAKSSHDLLRAVQLPRWSTALRAASCAIRHLRPTPVVYARYLTEMVRKKNYDARSPDMPPCAVP